MKVTFYACHDGTGGNGGTVNGQLHDPAVLHARKESTVRTEWEDRLASQQGWVL